MLRRWLRTATGFRLNASHMSPESLGEWLARLERVFDRPVPVVVDLQGAKMRIGKLPAETALGRKVTLLLGDEARGERQVPVPHRQLFAVVEPGETLTLDDGKVELLVTQVAGERMEARVLRGKTLLPFKGINRLRHPVPCDRMTPGDVERVEATRAFPFVEYAFSFVNTGGEARLLRALTGAPIAAKVERPEAMRHLGAIDRAFDAIWLARGDMGEQAGLAALGPIQTRFERRIPRMRAKAWLGGGVLEHMQTHPVPTRSEAVHLYDVSRRGWAGVILSGETATGPHQQEIADLMDALGYGRG